MLLEIIEQPLPLKTKGKYTTHRFLRVECDQCHIEFEIHKCVKKALERKTHCCCREHKTMFERRSEEDVKRQLWLVHGEQIELIGPYSKITTKCLFRDIEYGEWMGIPSELLRGCRHPNRAREAQFLKLEEAKCRLLKIHQGRVHLKDETFVNSTSYASFVDVDFGEWQAMPYSVLNGRGHPQRGTESTARAARLNSVERSTKRRATCQAKYGVDSHFKLKEFQDKASRTANKAIVEKHWKTGEDVVCVGSYELSVVRWLNMNQLDYEWQPGPFTMPNRRTYRPDALILDQPFANMYLEIKGYWRGRSKEKWDWFRAEHPNNSQLWMKKELQDLGILPSPKKRTKLIII